MTKVEDFAIKIRKLLNDSIISKTLIFLKKDKGFWDQLWASMDVIEDTELAIKSFKELTNEVFQKAPYVNTYGLLQALYLQQNAVSDLNEAIIGKATDWKNDYPLVFIVRTVRNESTGHPTKIRVNKSNKYATIDRSSLSKDGFSYGIWEISKFNKHNVNFSDLFQKQEEAICRELAKILKHIQDAEIRHKRRFANQSLAAILPSGEPYSLSLLRQVAYDEFAWMIFLSFKEKYTEIKKGIESRYGPIRTTLSVPGTKLLIDELDIIFLRVEELKISRENVDIDIGIYADALVEKLKELKKHLDEIDAEFK